MQEGMDSFNAPGIQADTFQILNSFWESTALQSKDLFHEILFDTSTPMAIISFKEGKIIDLNESFAHLTRHVQSELIGHNLLEYFVWTNPMPVDSGIGMLWREQGAQNLELKLKTKTTDPRIVSLCVQPVTLGTGMCLLCSAADITDRNNDGEKLRRSEQKYHALIKNSLQGLAIIQDSRFVFCSHAFAEMTGYSVEELLNLTADEMTALIHPKDRDYIENRRWGRISEWPLPCRYRYRSIKKDGSALWLDIFSSLIEYNEKPAVQSTFIDITENRQTQEALRHAEEKYRSIFEHAFEGIFRSAPDGSFQDVNPSLAEMFGYSSPEEFIASIGDIGQQLFIEPEKHTQYLHALKNHGLVRDFEFETVRRDGKKIWLSIHTRAIRDSAGRLLHYDGYVEDITERKQAEEKLRRALSWQEAIFEESRDAVIISDADSRFVDANAAACELTGYSKEELLHMSARDLNPEVDPSKIDAICKRILRNEDILEETAIFTKEGREIEVEFWHSRVIISGESYFHSIVRDITARKRLEAQFRQAQKMEAVGILAGGVAHDFNNLVTIIKGYTELLLTSVDPNDAQCRDLEQIENACRSAETLTTQLLAFSRKQILKPKILNLNSIIEDTHKMLRRLMPENIKIAVVPDPDLGVVNADPGQIQHIIMNLAVNARDAMPQGGNITIETANADFDENYVMEHHQTKEGPYVMLAISDNGIGMDDATRARIFEPFFTTKGRFKGTGLGLSTVYGIVKQSSGFIWAYSEPGKGTTFKIYFPRVAGETTPEVPDVRLNSASRGSETVLVVEDEAAVRILAGRILRDRGYTVLEAAEGTEALKQAQDHMGDIHLILTDVVMPGMSGRELVSEMVRIRPNMKVLYISGYTDRAIVHNGILDPDVAFLQKPFTIDGLARKVQEALKS